MTLRALAVGVLLAPLLWGAQYLADAPGMPDGQIVFVPVPTLSEESPTSGRAPFTVTACEDTPAGLEVSGVADAGNGVLSVAVSGGDPSDAGVAVGAGFLANSGQDAQNLPGSFSLVLGWASTNSMFAVLRPSPSGDWSSFGYLGQAIGCPGVS